MIKNAWVCTQASLPSKLLSLDLLKPFGLEKAEWYERILAHRIDCQRAISPPVQQKGNQTTNGVYGQGGLVVNRGFTISTVVLGALGTCTLVNQMSEVRLRFKELSRRCQAAVNFRRTRQSGLIAGPLASLPKVRTEHITICFDCGWRKRE